jgi:hypothetical protein
MFGSIIADQARLVLTLGDQDRMWLAITIEDERQRVREQTHPI